MTRPLSEMKALADTVGVRSSAGEIDEPPADCRSASREGVTTDELAKIRLWHLQAQSDTIMKQTILADTKAATLLALIGLVATKVAFGFQGLNVGLVEALLMANKAGVLCVCLWVIMPRFPGTRGWEKMQRYERFSWPALANPRLADYDYAEFARGADASQILMSIARANQGGARVLLAKFRRLRIAFLLAMVDVVLTIAYFLVWPR